MSTEGISPVRGVESTGSNTGLGVVNIATHLREMAKAQPYALAAVCPAGRDRAGRAAHTHWTFQQLDRESDAVARQVLERAGIVLDTARRQAARDGRHLHLSRKEFAVLEALLRAEGAVVSGEDLIEQVWEEHTSYRTNAVRVTLSKLRAKLGEPPVVETVPGAGYRIGSGARPEGE